MGSAPVWEGTLPVFSCSDDGPDVGGRGQRKDQADKQDRGGRPIEAISLAM